MEINLRATGQRIKKIRTQHNYTMLEFAKMLGFSSPSTVNNWEKGNNLPNDTRLNKIAILGNTTVNYIKYGPIKEYVLTLLKNTYPESKYSSFSTPFLSQLLQILHNEQVSYFDDLQILTIANNIYPELFVKNLSFNESIVGEESTSYSIETNKFYRKKVLPKVEKLFSVSETQSLNLYTLIKIVDLFNSSNTKDYTYLKNIHELIDCFLFLITLEVQGKDNDKSENSTINGEYAEDKNKKNDYLKEKNHLIALLDSFHMHYHF